MSSETPVLSLVAVVAWAREHHQGIRGTKNQACTMQPIYPLLGPCYLAAACLYHPLIHLRLVPWFAQLGIPKYFLPLILGYLQSLDLQTFNN